MLEVLTTVGVGFLSILIIGAVIGFIGAHWDTVCGIFEVLFFTAFFFLWMPFCIYQFGLFVMGMFA